MEIIIKGSPKEIAALERELKNGTAKTYNYSVNIARPSELQKVFQQHPNKEIGAKECRSCHRQIREDAVFCPKCGIKI